MKVINLFRGKDSICQDFLQQWQLAETDPEYVRLAARHRDQDEEAEPVAAKSPGSRQ